MEKSYVPSGIRTTSHGECPICFEVKDDLEVLEHWETHGDVSSHQMCGDCRARNISNECPFCKEIICKKEFIDFICEFVRNWKVTAHTDPNSMAAVFERWQYLEMMLDSSPVVIKRVAKMVLQDEEFTSVLNVALSGHQDWVRDIAGVIFRFWGLLHDDALDVTDHTRQLIDDSVEMILAPFERSTDPVQMCGHFYGALYMQVLVPFLCAQNSGFQTAQLRSLVQRTGKAIVHCYLKHCSSTLKREVTERMHVQYLTVAQGLIWDTQNDDVVWNTFYP
mmetsp:Transcript_33409/g.56081  ORF Transcript_33409/g.56081 Transcript_33409/m.56081 type:complete len:278 (-) Transcript_33409:1237-2070(-)